MLRAISEAVEKHLKEAISFLQEIIGTPSPSGREEEAAEIIAERMRVVGFDSVKVDELWDVMGTLKGSGGGRSLLMNGHIDHVPVGGMADPYSGRIMDGSAFGVEGEVVYGRAASDMKAAVAAMVTAGAVLRELGIELEGDMRVACVAQEEVGGAGTVSTIENDHFLGDLVLIGEATNMDLALGHRGSMKTSVVVRGRSCHASAPEMGVNALYKAMDMLDRIRADLVPRLPENPVYGKATITATQISVKPGALNVVPEECRFHLDCRNVPEFPAEALKEELEAIVTSLREEDPEFDAFVLPAPIIRGQRGFNGFYTDPDEHPVVGEAMEALTEAIGRQPIQKVWKFATDGRFYSWLGLPVVGFGPGEERFAHTHEDHVRVEDFMGSVKAYAWLACRICGCGETR